MRLAVDHRPVILKTAARLFARKPYHEVLMDDVAAEAGIAKGTIYRFYPNKEKLFGALGLTWMDRLRGELALIARSPRPVRARLREMIRHSAALYREQRDLFQVMQHHECQMLKQNFNELISRRKAIRQLYAGVIRQGQAAGEFRACDASNAADLLLGMVRSLLRFGDPKRSPEAIAEAVLDIFIHGVVSSNGERSVRRNPGRRNGEART